MSIEHGDPGRILGWAIRTLSETAMVMKVPSLRVLDESGKVRELPLYDSAKPEERVAVVCGRVGRRVDP